MTSKTIGETNGIWALLLKILLVCFVPWASYMTVNQVLDNNFRGKGERWTVEDAEVQTRAIINEVMLVWRESLLEHERMPGHSVIDQRVGHLEALFPAIKAENSERNGILRAMQQDIHTHIQWMQQQQRNGESIR